jgi:molecular chaperone GrpE
LSSEKKKAKNPKEPEVETIETKTTAEESAAESKEPKAAGTEEAKTPDPSKEYEEKLAQLNDRYLRLAAEYDNYRKRTKSELESVYSEAYSSAVLNFLPVFDNLNRAVLCEDKEGLAAGLNLVIKQISEICQKLGIEEIAAEGMEFDPNLHNAVLHTEDDSFGANAVAEVLQKGYMLKGKVIRHAMVKVAN